MRVPSAFLSLPPSLLLLLATQLHAQVDARDNGENNDVQTLPTAVRKMSLDEGEKFMPEYYAFASSDFDGVGSQAPLSLVAHGIDDSALTPDEEALLAANGSAVLVFRPPFPRHHGYRRSDAKGDEVGGGEKSPHEDESRSLYRRAREALGRLRGRAFTCPGGTHVCSNIDEPNYCCTDGTSCFVVANAPNAGNVGCCPDGQTCGGSVAACANGNTACPAEAGGGCCIAGFVCADIGCVQSAATVITPTTITTTQTPTSTSTSSTTTTPKPTTSTPTPTSSTRTTESSSGTGLPPVRPTSSTPDMQPTTTGDYCPTGFYGCMATAGSGCCRTGRDCSTTSCPPAASTTIITHGATIVVPLSDALAAGKPTATCAGGWFLCADSGPAGCCPSGYLCGTASCTLSAATSTATVQKVRPGNSAATRARAETLLWGLALGWAVFAWR